MKRILVILVMLVAMNVNAQWEPDVRLTNDPASSETSVGGTWCVAASGTVVHVVWTDSRDQNHEIYYKRSSDAGVSWGTDVRMSNNTANSHQPSVAVSGSVVHVLWIEGLNVCYKRSTDSGINWGADTNIVYNTNLWPEFTIAVTGSDVHVLWQDKRVGDWEIYYKRSTNAGISWGADTRLTNNIAASWDPVVAVSGSVVHFLWRDERDGNNQLFYNRSTDAGISWGTDTRLSTTANPVTFPTIAVSGSVVHAVWQSNVDIYYRHSTDAGISWDADTNLTISSNYTSAFPSIAVSASTVHIVWSDSRAGFYKTYYRRSIDAGVNWGAEISLTNNTPHAYYPSIAVNGSVVHVVWEDNRDGNLEIYYRRDTTGNIPTGYQNISTLAPSKYSLSQNYPNPFNPTTNIKFSIVNTGEVKLVVYDIQGREVQTLVNESLKPGTYEAAFDASTLNSGVYFYKLITNGFTETKKMLMIK